MSRDSVCYPTAWFAPDPFQQPYAPGPSLSVRSASFPQLKPGIIPKPCLSIPPSMRNLPLQNVVDLPDPFGRPF